MVGFWVQLDGGAMKFPEILDVGLEERGSEGGCRVLPFSVEGKRGKQGLLNVPVGAVDHAPVSPWFLALGGGWSVLFF